MSYTINGTCSLCGGAVTTPTFWWSIIPPTPTCSQCGATPVAPHGPVIPMQRARTVTGSSTCVAELETLLQHARNVGTGNPPPIMQVDTTASVRYELALICRSAKTGPTCVRTQAHYHRRPEQNTDTTAVA